MMGRLKSEQAQHFYQFQLSPPRSSGAEDRYCSRSFLAPQRTCTSLFVHGSAVDRPGTDDPDAGRGICLCDPHPDDAWAETQITNTEAGALAVAQRLLVLRANTEEGI